MLRRLIDIPTRLIAFAAALAREAGVAAVVYWVTRTRRKDGGAADRPGAP